MNEIDYIVTENLRWIQ